jgi:uncharacterized protein YecE (DUF72 family)
MEVYVGTSGWAYDWNRKKSLAWYVGHAGLNTIELNASFYGFPSEDTVSRWADAGSTLRWSVKVNRSVTHSYKFNERALGAWERFRERFSALDDRIDFFLFQAPPALKDLDRVIEFVRKAGIGDRCAVEIRNPEVLGDDEQCRRLQEEAVLVSVDSPDFQGRIFAGDRIYLRMHGRKDWYLHTYADSELREIKDRIVRLNPRKVWVFFNNDHSMLDNARSMMHLLSGSPDR